MLKLAVEMALARFLMDRRQTGNRPITNCRSLLALRAAPAYDAVSAVFREFPPEVSLERSDEEGRVRPWLPGASAEKDWA